LITDFPEFYHYHSEKEFEYANIRQENRNPLLFKNMGVDGVKTGYTEAGGYGLTASALRDGRRLIAVLNGMKDMPTRATESAKLIEYGYKEFTNKLLVKEGQVIVAPKVWLGKEATIPLSVAADVTVTLGSLEPQETQAMALFNEPIPAPVIKGATLGMLYVAAGTDQTLAIPLVASKDIDKAPLHIVIWNRLKLLIGL
jgi:D-alanyl-D-alanine carboxypeptidase (penicillin-binding protein 5/6)